MSRADRAAFQARLIEVDRSEVLAVAAVLPEGLRGATFTIEVKGAKDVASILTFDGVLARSEESSLVFGTKYCHVRCSL